MKIWLGRLHRLLFNFKFAARSRQWPAATARPQPPGLIAVSGFFNEVLGIGRAGALTVEALRDHGREVVMHDLRPLDRGLLTRPPKDFSEGREATVWLIHANAPETRIALYALAGWQHLYRIGYWAWESDLAPASWLAPARWLHEIWVPSTFTRDAFVRAFEAAGVGDQTGKLRVMPHLVPVATDAPAAPMDKGLRALAMFDVRSGFARKNPAGAIAAWLEAFPTPRPDTVLTLKSLAGGSDHEDFALLRALAGDRSDIVFITEDLSEAALDALIRQNDVLISLHRGEGFGLPLAEAMARGVSVIATGYSGNMDFMTPDNSVLVPWQDVPAAKAYNGPNAHWAEPDIASAALALRALAEDPTRRRRLGENARRDIAALRLKGWR